MLENIHELQAFEIA